MRVAIWIVDGSHLIEIRSSLNTQIRTQPSTARARMGNSIVVR